MLDFVLVTITRVVDVYEKIVIGLNGNELTDGTIIASFEVNSLYLILDQIYQ